MYTTTPQNSYQPLDSRKFQQKRETSHHIAKTARYKGKTPSIQRPPTNYTSSPPLISTGTPPPDTATVPRPRHSGTTTPLQGHRVHQAPPEPGMASCLHCHRSVIAPKEMSFKTMEWMGALPRMPRVVFVIRAGLSSDGSSRRRGRSLVGLRVVGAELVSRNWLPWSAFWIFEKLPVLSRMVPGCLRSSCKAMEFLVTGWPFSKILVVRRKLPLYYHVYRSCRNDELMSSAMSTPLGKRTCALITLPKSTSLQPLPHHL